MTDTNILNEDQRLRIVGAVTTYATLFVNEVETYFEPSRRTHTTYASVHRNLGSLQGILTTLQVLSVPLYAHGVLGLAETFLPFEDFTAFQQSYYRFV